MSMESSIISIEFVKNLLRATFYNLIFSKFAIMFSKIIHIALSTYKS